MNIPTSELKARNELATQTEYVSTEIDTLLCQTYLRKDMKIDHVAISDVDSMIIVGRYEIPDLIEYLQTLYDMNDGE